MTKAPAGSCATASSDAAARVNRTTIVGLLRAVEILSRQQVGDRTGLSPPTVNRLTALPVTSNASASNPKSGQLKAGEGGVRRVEVVRRRCARTPIIGRPRSSPLLRRTDLDHTLDRDRDEPFISHGMRLETSLRSLRHRSVPER